MDLQLFKYYKGEDKSPYPEDDIRSKFWWGEMMYSKGDNSFVDWAKEGQIWLQEASEEIKQLANKYSPEQFGVITYISCLYGKWCPYDDPMWILDY